MPRFVLRTASMSYVCHADRNPASSRYGWGFSNAIRDALLLTRHRAEALARDYASAGVGPLELVEALRLSVADSTSPVAV